MAHGPGVFGQVTTGEALAFKGQQDFKLEAQRDKSCFAVVAEGFVLHLLCAVEEWEQPSLLADIRHLLPLLLTWVHTCGIVSAGM